MYTAAARAVGKMTKSRAGSWRVLRKKMNFLRCTSHLSIYNKNKKNARRTQREGHDSRGPARY